MSNLQLIEALCKLAEDQMALLRELAFSMERERCISDAELAEVEHVGARYSAILGADEWSDNI